MQYIGTYADLTSKRSYPFQENYTKQPKKKNQKTHDDSESILTTKPIGTTDILPTELWRLILTHLDETSLNSAQLVNKEFDSVVSDIRNPNFYIDAANRMLEVSHKIAKSNYVMLNITSDVQVPETQMTLKTQKNIRFILELVEAFKNSSETNNLFYPVTEEERNLSISDPLILIEKTLLNLGILFNLEKSSFDCMFKKENGIHYHAIRSFNQLCKFKFPVSLIRKMIKKSDFIETNLSENTLNSILMHPERLKICRLVNEIYPHALRPVTVTRCNSINRLITLYKTPKDLEILPFLLEKNALPVYEATKKTHTTYTKIISKKKPELTIEFLYQLDLAKKAESVEWKEIWQNLYKSLTPRNQQKLLQRTNEYLDKLTEKKELE